MSAFGLDNAVALVTGAAGGIGSAICSALSEAGARVVGVDRSATSDETLGWGSECRRCDVANAAEVNALVDDIVSEHGGLDLLVHAAGITRDGIHWRLSDEEWREVLSVNLDSAFYLLRAAAPQLRASSRSAVVLISSINAERGKLGQANYAASKAGLIGLARSAARDLGRDAVRVNVVAPGFITTAMTASLPEEIKQRAIADTVFDRAGSPEDVAGAVLFLCSKHSRHVTGQVLRVDGGQLMA